MLYKLAEGDELYVYQCIFINVKQRNRDVLSSNI